MRRALHFASCPTVGVSFGHRVPRVPQPPFTATQGVEVHSGRRTLNTSARSLTVFCLGPPVKPLRCSGPGGGTAQLCRRSARGGHAPTPQDDDAFDTRPLNTTGTPHTQCIPSRVLCTGSPGALAI